MERLLVLADDLTGALDTGVQFTERGAKTGITMDPSLDFSAFDPEMQVIVLNLESRHIPPADAYNLVLEASKNASRAGIRYIYKKTDSGLRGNIGAELAAVLDGADAENIIFVPAFPRSNRNTLGGIHYIDGVPVAESIFGKDPLDPVTKSKVSEIIGLQTGTPCFDHSTSSTKIPAHLKGIHIFDASSNEDLEKIAASLGKEGLHYSAGCSGFAAHLAGILGFDGAKPRFPELPTNILMVCGSVNPINIRQMDIGERAGYRRIRLTPEQELDAKWPSSEEGLRTIDDWVSEANSHGKFILDSNEAPGSDELAAYMKENALKTEDIRIMIAPRVGKIARLMLDRGLNATMICTGGDTLTAFMKEIGIASLSPIAEISTGCVLTSFPYKGKIQYLITKSGGFGTPDVLLKLSERVSATNAERQ